MRPLACLLLLAATSCGKSTEDTAAGAGAAAKTDVPPAAAPEPAKPPPQILCDKAISKELMAKHVPDTQAEFGEPFDNGEGSFITSCRFVNDAKKARTIVRYKCGPTFSNLEAYLGAVEPQIKADDGGKFKFGRVDGIGRGAFRDKTSIAALHRDMPCIVEVDEMGDREVPDWTAFLKDLEAALSPAAAK